MATEADHIALANKNHEVLIYLLNEIDRFPEWVTVVAFYKAVQILEAVFVHRHGLCCHGHQKRLDALKSRGYQVLHKHYRALWSASSVARYLFDSNSNIGYKSFSDYISSDKLKTRILKKRLYGFECEALGLLSATCQANLLRIPDNL
jgi:hypothetical protein